MTALPPDLQEAVETVRGGLPDSTPYYESLEATETHDALALIEQRLMEYRTALEMIRDKRSEGGERRDAITGATIPSAPAERREGAVRLYDAVWERAERAEAQRDRLAEALREIRNLDPDLTDDGYERGPDSQYADDVQSVVDSALSEIEQAASNDGEKEAVT